ncbi:hypothetical protein MIMGU_mgv1a023076mg [Erythranthe guttata]|uniref:Uncharacterized protein n=1 Tax=Erythranthe guttata TaxID=4155 RepID=A0A022RCT6_ERYGU|nr:hypothetical protein MIMGU_mgv1a023076mg [Erythranthe guttata]
MEWGAPGEIHLIPGLPIETNITYHDLARRRNHPPRAAAADGGGPPQPGDLPPWVPLVEGSIALMFNTCEYLEHTFITYLANQMGPAGFQIRQPNKNQSNYNEDQILQWLDNKPKKSVLYVAFGSEVSPTNQEILQLACALEEMAYSFIWVVLNGTSIIRNILDDLDKKIDDRCFIVRGWAPQLLILSHPSTGGFLSHCGWNSTMEAVGCGVRILAWPIRGDQIYNAKLVANHLRIGYMALPSCTNEMTKDDLISGIDKLMTDEDVRKRAEVIRAKLSVGFPSSSMFAIDAFIDVIQQNQN